MLSDTRPLRSRSGLSPQVPPGGLARTCRLQGTGRPVTGHHPQWPVGDVAEGRESQRRQEAARLPHCRGAGAGARRQVPTRAEALWPNAQIRPREAWASTGPDLATDACGSTGSQAEAREQPPGSAPLKSLGRSPPRPLGPGLPTCAEAPRSLPRLWGGESPSAEFHTDVGARKPRGAPRPGHRNRVRRCPRRRQGEGQESTAEAGSLSRELLWRACHREGQRGWVLRGEQELARDSVVTRVPQASRERRVEHRRAPSHCCRISSAVLS